MRMLIRIAGVLLILVAIVAVAVWWLVDAEALRPRVEAALTTAVAREVRIERMELSLTRLALTAEGISIAEDAAFGGEPFVAADRLAIAVAWWPLLTEQRLHVYSLALTEPRIRLVQNRKGQWNFASLGATPTAAPAEPIDLTAIAIESIRVADGQVSIQRAGRPERLYRGLSLQLDDLAPGVATPFRIAVQPASGGRLVLSGEAGPFDPGALTATPVTARVELAGVDLARLSQEMEADDSGLSGIAGFDSDLRIADGRLSSTGEIEIAGLRLIESGAAASQPARIRYALDYGLQVQRGRVQDGRLVIGEADLSLTGRFDLRGNSPRLDMVLEGREVPVDGLQALLPMLAIALPEDSRLAGGHASARLHLSGPSDALVIAGPVALRDSRLVGFGIGERLGAAMAIAGLRAPADTVLRSADSDLRIDASGVALSAIRAEIAEFGRLEGDGRISPEQMLDFRFVARLAEEAIADSGLGGRFGAALETALRRGSSDGIAFKVAGSATEPSFSVDQRSLAKLGAGALLGAALAGSSADGQPAEGESTPPTDLRSTTDALKQKAVESLFKRLGGRQKTQDDSADEEAEGDEGGG